MGRVPLMAGPNHKLTRRGLLASGAMLGAGVFAACIGPSGTPRPATTAPTAVGAAAPGVSSQAAGTLPIIRGSGMHDRFSDRTAATFKGQTVIFVHQPTTTGTL